MDFDKNVLLNSNIIANRGRWQKMKCVKIGKNCYLEL